MFEKVWQKKRGKNAKNPKAAKPGIFKTHEKKNSVSATPYSCLP